MRVQAYQALLSGASGQLFGNNPIWHFDGPGLHPKPMEWKEALDSPGARRMSVLIRLFSDLEWWRPEPDISGRLLVLARGPVAEGAVAASADDGSYALAYVPSPHMRVPRDDGRPFHMIVGSDSTRSWAGLAGSLKLR